MRLALLGGAGLLGAQGTDLSFGLLAALALRDHLRAGVFERIPKQLLRFLHRRHPVLERLDLLLSTTSVALELVDPRA